MCLEVEEREGTKEDDGGGGYLYIDEIPPKRDG